jgi:poly(hydroxyalkanoate) depolymerase family esterase
MRAAGSAHAGVQPRPTTLPEVTDFGWNPGGLRMFVHVPEKLQAAPALVVVLHGCTQTAEGYAAGAGWITLADRHGFVLLLPEQTPANNPKNCFNWFLPGDITRNHGEPLSIRQMIEKAILDHGVDRNRVYITGLSAGGAMTAVMLASYPEVFAAGAVIAGLPYGVATNVEAALNAMFTDHNRPIAELEGQVRRASRHAGPWPRVSIWHGTADVTVKPSNADELVKQWTAVHGLPLRPTREERGTGFARRVWQDRDGRDLVESYTVNGMAHGTPLATGTEADRCGRAGPFLLDVGISSSYRIAKFWGLVDETASLDEPTLVPQPSAPQDADRRVPAPALDPAPASETAASGYGRLDVQAVITKALKAAGLIKSH